jgi:hypothetical protein
VELGGQRRELQVYVSKPLRFGGKWNNDMMKFFPSFSVSKPSRFGGLKLLTGPQGIQGLQQPLVFGGEVNRNFPTA